MSKNKDNNKPIKDFLSSNRKASDKPDDDFDKEAMEGFDLIQNEDEILDLKEKLDARMFKEVFATEKTTSKVYWYAAAALFLIIGFSVYFIRNNSITEKETLALESESSRRLQTQPHTEKQNEETLLNQDIRQEENTAAKNKEVADNTPALQNQFKHIPIQETKQGKQETDVSDQKSLAANDQEFTIMSEPSLAMTENENKEIRQVPVTNPTVNSNDVPHTANEDIAENRQNKTLNEIQVVSTEGLKRKNSLKKSRSKSIENTVTSGTGPASADDSFKTICYYPGGEDSLVKILHIRLKAKDLLQKFNAVLYVTPNGKVDKVSFTNSFNLNSAQRLKLIQILKELDNFLFTNPVSDETLTEYNLAFKP